MDALLDAGADINAPGAVIAGGTPLTDATAFGQWAAARRPIERGARTSLWDAAALGLLDQVRDYLTDTRTTPQDITSSLWGACHGGHPNTAAYLLDRGGDINWIGYDGLTPLDAARRSGADNVIAWLEARTRQQLDPTTDRHPRLPHPMIDEAVDCPGLALALDALVYRDPSSWVVSPLAVRSSVQV